MCHFNWITVAFIFFQIKPFQSDIFPMCYIFHLTPSNNLTENSTAKKWMIFNTKSHYLFYREGSKLIFYKNLGERYRDSVNITRVLGKKHNYWTLLHVVCIFNWKISDYCFIITPEHVSDSSENMGTQFQSCQNCKNLCHQ